MTDVETLIRRELDQVVRLPDELEPDWGDVTQRLGRSPGAKPTRPAAGLLRRARRRPLLALLIVVVVALIPVSALAVSKNDPWWFLRFNPPSGFRPAKGSQVIVIKQGSWSGQGWVLTAYKSGLGQLCFQLTQKAADGQRSSQGGGGCGAIPGSRARGPHGSRQITITYLGGGISATKGHPPIFYLAGPVVNNAAEVEITLTDGSIVRTPTFSAPAVLGLPIRFYATQLPAGGGSHLTCRQNAVQQAGLRPLRLVGLDSSGHTVAKLALPPFPGRSPNILCQPHRNDFVLPPEVPAAGRKLKKIARVTGPYHAVATISLGATVPIVSYRAFPISPRPRVVQPSRCWRVGFSNGQSQGTCTPNTKRHDPPFFLGYLEIQHAGRDTFVIAQATPRTGPSITRITLLLANRQALDATPIDGIAVFAIPRNALSTTKSQRGFLNGYDSHGALRGRQPVYYRSCPPSSSCD
jgi:hypothetical protein